MIDDLLTPYDAAAFGRASPVRLVRETASKKDLADAPASLAALARLNGFGGESGSVVAGEDGVLVGVGDGRDPFAVAAAAERLPAGDYALAKTDPAADMSAACLGWLLGGYRFDRYKEAKRAEARLVAPEGVDTAAVKRAAAAVYRARDLVNTPAGDMLPDALQAAVEETGARFDAGVETIVGEALLERNFPVIHAVGRASTTPPRLIELVWGPAAAPKLTLIGKGVCFDSGGLNLKGAGGMALMKKDMGGAANALALAEMIMSAKLPVRLRLLIPAVENAVSGSAFRPGDVLRARSGLTIEIGNTDAEGRLILADAMAYAGEAAPDVTVTLATLTGAARVALGPDLPPLYCDDDAFADAVVRAGAQVHDPSWRMPLWPDYEAMLASSIADLNNAPGGPFAGSILAALFLKRFAPASGLWAHIDLYAWRPKAAPGRPVGGEAQTIRALFKVFERRFARP
ncbi:MAG: M17 family metallopeptidase [Parvularculaceae bacterium]